LSKVSVPGSIMLFGEHAVLRGKMAIVAAVDFRLQVNLIFNNNNKIYITSSFGNKEFDLNDLNSMEINITGWQFVMASIKYFNLQQKINMGFSLSIEDGNLKNSVGFGSSAAVVVGVLAVLNDVFSKNRSEQDLFKQSLSVVHQVQNGHGSGADLAASIYGGIISFKDFRVQKILKKSFDLTAVYCGYKTKTTDVIKIINNKIVKNKKLYNYIFNTLNNCSKLAMSAVKLEDLQVIGKLMNIAHGLMTGMGVVDANLDQLACTLRAQSTIYGAKISGAGLGDCIIGLGKLTKNLFKENQFDIQTTMQGLIWLE